MSPKARALEKARYALFTVGILVRVAFFGVVLTGRRAWRWQDAIERRVRPQWAGPPLTLLSYLLVYWTVLLPPGLAGYLVDRHFGLSVEGPGRWAADVGRSWGVAGAIAVPTLLVLLWTMRRWPRLWWLPATAVVAVISAFSVYLAPVLIDPLYHRFTPLPPGRVRDAILGLTQAAHVHVNGVYVGQFSATTTEGNAYMTGLGGSQRIVVWDTLLKSYPLPELRAILAHELGHYVLHHIILGLGMAIGGSMCLFLFLSWLLRRGEERGWLRKLGEPATAAPLVAVILAINTLGLPVTNTVSRWIESQADAFSLRITQDPGAFIGAMQRLTRQDYDDPWPSALETAVFYDHPPVSLRIRRAARFAAERHLPIIVR